MSNNNLRNISLKKKIKFLKLKTFFDNFSIICIFSDVNLNSLTELKNVNLFKNKEFIKVINVKTNLFMNLLKSKDKNISSLNYKGPLLLLGLNNFFDLFILFNKISSSKSNLILLGFQINNNFYNYKSKNILNLYKNGYLSNSLLLNKFIRKEFMKTLIVNSFIIENKLISKLFKK